MAAVLINKLGKSPGQRSLVGCSPWGLEQSDTTEQFPFHFSLSCIGEGNGNPLQRSCLENPRDGGAWWATVYGVAQSWTWVKRLSSSSSILQNVYFYKRRKYKISNWRISIGNQRKKSNINLRKYKKINIKDYQFSSVAQSCPTRSDPMDCSLPGSAIHGIFHARVLEWGAIAFSNR